MVHIMYHVEMGKSCQNYSQHFPILTLAVQTKWLIVCCVSWVACEETETPSMCILSIENLGPGFYFGETFNSVKGSSTK